jgi:hypothetical protein
MEFDEKDRFIHDILFAGVKNRNVGFDSLLIPHVSPEDFEVVLDHCAETGSAICGIEILDVSRWDKDHQVDFLGVWFPEEEGLDWTRDLVRQYAGQPNITVCASFYTPEEDVAHRANPDWRKQCVDLKEALGGGVRKHRSSGQNDCGMVDLEM